MSKTFCPLLFQHLATHPYGGVTHCCIADHTNQASNAYNINEDGKRHVLNINNDSIYDIFNSESFRKARLQSLNDEIPPACSRCFKEEEASLFSKRQLEIGNYPDFDVDQARAVTNNNGYIENPQFDFVELRLGNTCNVACRTCNPASSSKWRKDYDALSESVSFSITEYTGLSGFRWPEEEAFWDELFDYCYDAKVFYINGGEPMLIKQHFKFLNRLIEAGRTDITLWYNINMTLLNEEVLGIWANFKEVRISCSIDDLAERNEYIRHPTDWDTVLKNFHILRENKWIKLDITQTISFMNYANIVEFYKFFQEKYGVMINHNIVHDPAYLSPKVLPREIVEDVWKKLDASTMRPSVVTKLKECVGTEQDRDGWGRARNYTKSLDQIRKQSISEVLPEFQRYFSFK